MVDPLASWATAASAFATLVIAVLTWLGMKSSKRTLELLEAKESRQELNLQLLYSDSKVYTLQKMKQRIFLVELDISNLSDSPNSIRRIDFIIKYADDTGSRLSLVVPYEYKYSDDIDIPQNQIINLPIFLDTRSSIRSWFQFSVPEKLLSDKSILSYVIDVVDISNNEKTIECSFFQREIIEEK